MAGILNLLPTLTIYKFIDIALLFFYESRPLFIDKFYFPYKYI